MIRPPGLNPRITRKRGQTFLHLRKPLFLAPQFGDCPPAQNSLQSELVVISVFGTKCDRTLCSLRHYMCFPPILMQSADPNLSKGQTKGMGQGLSQRERFLGALE